MRFSRSIIWVLFLLVPLVTSLTATAPSRSKRSPSTYSSPTKHGHLITLRAEILDTTSPETKSLRATHRVLGIDNDKRGFMVHHDKNQREELKSRLRGLIEPVGATKVDYFHYLPHHTFIVPLGDDQVGTVEGFPGVDTVLELLPQWKYDANFLSAVDFVVQKHPTVILSVSLVQPLQFGPSTGSKWSDSLSGIAGIPVTLQAQRVDSGGFTTTILVVLPADKDVVKAAVEWLALQPPTMWIERVSLEAKLRNAEAKVITNPPPPSSSPNFPRYQSLTGKGQIVAVIDTGLDYNSCYFYDPVNPIGPNHRKILEYHGAPGDNCVGQNGVQSCTQDYVDDRKGHGTHVVGSILGSAIGNSSAAGNFNGIAPDAKVIFYDNGIMGVPGLQTSADMVQSFSHAYNQGARIHSNSWGSANTDYTDFTRSVDEAAHELPELLILFAAGNSGDDSGIGSIGDPASAKNVLTVGASRSTNNGLKHFFSFEPQWFEYQKTRYCCRTVGCSWASMGLAYARDYPSDCDDLSQGNCAALIAQKLPTICSHSYDQNCLDFSLPQFPCNEKEYPPLAEYAEHDLAPFSSIGPTPDGRNKPDLVAPGDQIFSAKSYPTKNGTCNASSKEVDYLMALQGTSMATPVTAGLAALLRQYLVEGLHPSGPHTPTSALMKALLIHSASPLMGYARYSPKTNLGTVSMAHAPSDFQGHGLVHLDKILWPKSAVHFFDGPEDTLNSSEPHKTYCFLGTSVSDLVITLVYTDLPGHPLSSVILVNDLDLHVILPGGKRIEQNDDVNNVEKYLVSDTFSGEAAVIVIGNNIVTSQRFALVVSGSVIPVTCSHDYMVNEYDSLKAASIFLGILVILLLVVIAGGYVYWRKSQGLPLFSFAKNGAGAAYVEMQSKDAGEQEKGLVEETGNDNEDRDVVGVEADNGDQEKGATEEAENS